jgi:hypothetical protein
VPCINQVFMVTWPGSEVRPELRRLIALLGETAKAASEGAGPRAKGAA